MEDRQNNRGMPFPQAVGIMCAVVCVCLLMPYWGVGIMFTMPVNNISGINGFIAQLLSVVLLNIPIGLGVGVGLYRVYKRISAHWESDLTTNVAWWGSVLLSGVLTFALGFAFERFVLVPTGLVENAVPSHATLAAMTGLAFGAGFGQGERLM